MSFTRESLNRRDFLKTLAGTGAALGVPDTGLSASSGMYVSLHPVLTNQKPAWPEFARLAARAGYGGVDMEKDMAMKEGLDATRRLFAELKVKPAVARPSLNFGRDEAGFQAVLKGIDAIGKFAAAVDCPRIAIVMPASSETPKAELRKIYKDRLTAVAEILRRSNVRFGLEFMGPLEARKRQKYEFIWRMDEMLDFAKECGPNVGLLVDSWHWYHAGATVDEIIAAGKSRIVHIHVADCARIPPEEVRDSQRLMPGEGVIDLVGFFQALKKIGYEDGIAPEVLGRVPKDMSPEDGARLGLETTLAVMRKARVA